MKKILLLILCMVLSHQFLLAQKNMYVNSSNGINLREGSGTNYKTISTIPNGYKVKVINIEDEWAKVEYEGKTGYVSSQYLSESKPQNNSTSSNTKSSSNKSSSSKPGQSGQGSTRGSNDRSSSSQEYDRSWGIGLRLGDPLGVTAKKYLSSGNALEFNLGSSTYYGVDYRDDFYSYSKYNDYDYVNYNRGSSISFQAHYLFQKDFPNAKNLQWYWGVGPQLRFRTYEYYYRFRQYYGDGPGDYTWAYAYDKVTNVDLGVDVLIGLEYHIPKAPLSVFGDVNVMTELLDDPFNFFLQGGIGIRYNFK